MDLIRKQVWESCGFFYGRHERDLQIVKQCHSHHYLQGNIDIYNNVIMYNGLVTFYFFLMCMFIIVDFHLRGKETGEQESIFVWWFVLQTSAGVPKWGWSQEPVLTAGLDCGWGSPLLPLRGYRKQAAEVRAGAGVERRFSDRDKGRCKWHLNFSTQQPRINKYLFNYLKVNTYLQNISLLGPAW